MLINKAISKGFTLIELLVVITIIGILATGATTIYTSQIQKARDTTRISDVKALQSAVEQVYQDGSEYPHSDLFLTGSTGVGVSTYMPKLPRDPKNGQACNDGGLGAAGATVCLYTYRPAQDDNGIKFAKYIISTGFESAGKVKSDGARDAGLFDFRWEAGNGNIGATKVDTNVTPTMCPNTAAVNQVGIRGSACLVAPTTESEIITIHGS